MYYNISNDMNSKLKIAMYHYTRDINGSRYPNIKGLDFSLFEKQLQFFKNNFNVITMENLLDYVNKGTNLPEKALLLTFDDGYIDNYLVALPLLKKYNMQGSFFIPAKTFVENKLLDVNKIHFILASNHDIKEILNDLYIELDNNRINNNYPSNSDLYDNYAKANRFDDKDTIFVKRILQEGIPEGIRSAIASKLFSKYVGLGEEIFAKELYMNKEQIRLMKQNGMFIGVHGYDHYWLDSLSYDDMRKDIDKALVEMDEFIDKNNWVMNYPYGAYNNQVIEYIKLRGCKLGLSTDVNEVNLEKDNIYALPRLDCNDFPPKSDNYLIFNND